MKLKIVILCILFVFIGVYGWRFYYGAFNNYKNLQDTIEEVTETSNSAAEILDETAKYSETLKSGYKVASSSALFDYVDEFLSSTSCNFSKAIGKRFVNNATTTVMSCNSMDELHNLSNIDALEVIVTVNDLVSFLQKIENDKYYINKLTIYPTDNCVSVEFFVIGGVN